MQKIIKQAKEVIRREIKAVSALLKRVDQSFTEAVNLILNCQGRVIVTGMGKSGIIGQKLAATLTSTGTPAHFLHPVEAMHGDLGVVGEKDLIIIISKSGETEEIYELLPTLKRLGVKIVSLVGNLNSPLVRMSDVALDVSVKEEACPLDLIPTSSTTAALVMSDALAVAVFSERNFQPEDFALLHPKGTLGRKVLLRVEDLMLKGKDIPVVSEKAKMKEAILEMTSKRGITTIVDKKGKLLGVITDGDLRRLLDHYSKEIFSLPVTEVMNRSPKTITKEELAAKAAKLMESYRITALIVIDNRKHPVGIIHLHDIMQAGVV
ncbi:MAG: KpsF/GutQ family sugar-phosphate isomerase [Candidatus Edwardsbacteria bacterium]